jgi:protein tyrosine/serine phosphatase
MIVKQASGKGCLVEEENNPENNRLLMKRLLVWNFYKKTRRKTMPKKKRISIKEINVRSFVTTLENSEQIRGGETKEPCTSNDCTIYVNCTIPPNTSSGC